MMRIGLFLLTNIAVILVASFTLSLLGVPGYLQQNGDINFTSLLIFCAVFGMAGSFVSLALSKFMAKRGAGVKIIEQAQTQEEQWLLDTVAELSQKAGIGMPEVGIFPSPQSNAFATGMNRNNALVAVSQGLLRNMDRRAVRAVIGHEIGHVANGDMITLSLLQGVINTFVMFFARVLGTFIDRAVFKNENDGHGMGYFLVVMVLEVILGILASTIVMWFSRFREYRADAAGAALTDKQSMIMALESLRREYDVPSQLPETMQAFGIRGGLPKNLGALFASHPPLEMRIKALQTIQG